MNHDAFRTFENRCVSALARREHSRAELASKADADMPAEVVAAVLDKLEEHGWQSDARFCHSFVRQKSQNGDGALKVRFALKSRGIKDALIREALDSVDWYDIAAAVYAKKYRTAAASPNEQAKRRRFMAQRGFSFDEIKHAEHSVREAMDA